MYFMELTYYIVRLIWCQYNLSDDITSRQGQFRFMVSGKFTD